MEIKKQETTLKIVSENKLLREALFVEEYTGIEIIGQLHSVLTQQATIYKNLAKSYISFKDYLSKEKFAMKDISKLQKDIDDLTDHVTYFIKMMKKKVILPMIDTKPISKNVIKNKIKEARIDLNKSKINLIKIKEEIKELVKNA